MSGYRNRGRHSAPTDPMMTNSYLIRASTIRDAALQDADRRESISRAGRGGGLGPILLPAIVRSVWQLLRRLAEVARGHLVETRRLATARFWVSG